MKYIILFVISIFFVSGCGSNSPQQEYADESPRVLSANDSLYDEVMRIHDQVMPRMDELYKIKKEIQTRLNMPQAALTTEEQKKIEMQVAALEAAHSGMMVWMREFNPPADSLGETVMRTYLNKEMEKIKTVRENILSALEEAAENN